MELRGEVSLHLDSFDSEHASLLAAAKEESDLAESLTTKLRELHLDTAQANRTLRTLAEFRAGIVMDGTFPQVWVIPANQTDYPLSMPPWVPDCG